MAPSSREYTAISTADPPDSIKLQQLKQDDIDAPDDADDAGSIEGLRPSPRNSASDRSIILGDIIEIKRKGYLTSLHAVAFTISLQIGAGIFATPSQVAQHVSSPGAAVCIWLAGGFLSWTGAASLIELGLAIPQNGGTPEYLSQLWGDFPGYLCSWMTLLILRPGSLAVVSMVFSEHLSHVIIPLSLQSAFVSKFVALVGVAVFAFLNCIGVKSGAHTATIFLVLKLLAVTSIPIVALIAIYRGKAEGVPASGKGWFGSQPIEDTPLSIFAVAGNYANAAFGALWALGGAETAGEIAGDMKNPRRDIPWVINVCMTIAIVAAVSMNVALYEVLPISTIRDRIIPAVNFGIATMGPAAGVIYSLIVSMSAIGSINASLFVGARQYTAGAEHGYMPAIFANLHFDLETEKESIYYDNALKGLPSIVTKLVKGFASRTAKLRLEKRVPVYPIVVSYLLSSFYIMIGTFNGLIIFGGIVTTIFQILMVAGIYRLRRTELGLNEGQRYKAWTINPVIYFIVELAMLLTGMATHPWMGLVIVSMIVLVYGVFRTTFRKTYGALDSREDAVREAL